MAHDTRVYGLFFHGNCDLRRLYFKTIAIAVRVLLLLSFNLIISKLVLFIPLKMPIQIN